MINLAFCYELNDELRFMEQEVINCFQQKGIAATVKCYHNAYELLRCINCNCPDILFYDIEGDNGLIREAAVAAKKENKKLVSIVTQRRDYVPNIKDTLLEPIFVLPEKSRRHLWSYASLAYETVLDDEDSFSYYVRPDYVHVFVEDIKYFASEGRRTHIVTSDCHDTFYQKLDVVERLIRPKNGHFLRIHKSYLVNARYISSYSRDFVTLTTGEKLRISRYEYYKALNNRFRNSGIRRCPRYTE